MTRHDSLTFLYSLRELLELEDSEPARRKALNVITKAIEQAEPKQTRKAASRAGS